MRWRGTLIGGALGWILMVGSPLGAVLGALIGGAVDSMLTDDQPRSRAGNRRFQPTGGRGPDAFSNTDRSFLFVLHLVGIMTVVARADGNLDQREVRAMRRFFEGLGFRGEDLQTIQRLTKEAVQSDLNLLEICEEYGRISTYEERLLLVRAIYVVAAADELIHPTEQSIIDRVVSYMGIQDADHRSIRAEFRAHTGRSRQSAAHPSNGPYAVLGVKPQANVPEIKKAYREMAGKYHPDRVNHLGPEFVKLANEKFRALHEAYTAVRKERGF